MSESTSNPAGQSELDNALSKPKSVTVDGQNVTQHSIDDHIKAEQHKASKRATNQPGFGLRFARMRPGSAVGE